MVILSSDSSKEYRYKLIIREQETAQLTVTLDRRKLPPDPLVQEVVHLTEPPLVVPPSSTVMHSFILDSQAILLPSEPETQERSHVLLAPQGIPRQPIAPLRQ